MSRGNREITEQLRHDIFRILCDDPGVSQRELARQLGISVGKVNYCLRALIEKGWIKARNFKRSENKLRYAYLITPSGIEEKARLTLSYLKIKLREHAELVRIIEELKLEVAEIQESGDGSLKLDPELESGLLGLEGFPGLSEASELDSRGDARAAGV